MLDWLKFFPFATHTKSSQEEVRGPYLQKLKKHEWRLGDSLLTYMAPISNPILSLSGDGWPLSRLSPGRDNILETNWAKEYLSGSDAPRSEWLFDYFYSNRWYFVGPWFTGVQARLAAAGFLVRPRDHSRFIDKNLFHPRIFELAIGNFLDNRFGYQKNGSAPHYRGPLNWRTLPISNSIQAVMCDIHQIGNSSKEDPLLIRLVFLPITPHAYIYITFDFGGTKIFRDKVCAEPMFKLCDSIINSFKLEVGPQTQEEWDKVKTTCPNMSLTDSFGELKWPLKKEKKSNRPNELDITPQSDPLVIQAPERQQ